MSKFLSLALNFKFQENLNFMRILMMWFISHRTYLIWSYQLSKWGHFLSKKVSFLWARIGVSYYYEKMNKYFEKNWIDHLSVLGSGAKVSIFEFSNLISRADNEIEKLIFVLISSPSRPIFLNEWKKGVFPYGVQQPSSSLS